MVQVTPFPVETPPPTTSSYTRLPDVTPEAVEYVAVFYETLAFKQNKTAYSYQLDRPPMVIEMCIKPNMTTRTIWYETDTTIPIDSDDLLGELGTPDEQGYLVLLGDGEIMRLSPDISAEDLRKLVTINGREPVFPRDFEAEYKSQDED